jgi:hypothetical protein
MRTEPVCAATGNHLFQTVLIMALRLPRGAKLNQHQVCCKAAGPGVFIFRIAKHRGSGKGCHHEKCRGGDHTQAKKQNGVHSLQLAGEMQVGLFRGRVFS